MKRNFRIFIIFLIISLHAKTQNSLPQVVSGKIKRYENFQSRYVTERNIDIWLPNDYSDTIKYSVLYMHDGQMLYDPSQSWNKQSWNVDDMALELLSKDNIKNFIVVGIWNGGQTRHQDYFPKKPFEQLSKIEKDTVSAQLQRAGRISDKFQPQSDKYLKFIVKELKPYIDSKYSVKKDRENTFIAGSSMGGAYFALCNL